MSYDKYTIYQIYDIIDNIFYQNYVFNRTESSFSQLRIGTKKFLHIYTVNQGGAFSHRKFENISLKTAVGRKDGK